MPEDAILYLKSATTFVIDYTKVPRSLHVHDVRARGPLTRVPVDMSGTKYSTPSSSSGGLNKFTLITK